MCTVSIKVNDNLLHKAWANMGYDVDMTEWMQQQMEAILIRVAMASEKATPASQAEEQSIPDIVLSLLGAGMPLTDDDLNGREAYYNYSAMQANVEAIITRNGKDFANSKLPVFTASEFLANFTN